MDEGLRASFDGSTPLSAACVYLYVCVCVCVCVSVCVWRDVPWNKLEHTQKKEAPREAPGAPLTTDGGSCSSTFEKKREPETAAEGVGVQPHLLSFLFLFFNSPFFFLSIQLESILSQCTGFSSMFTEFYRVLLGFSQLHLWITGFYRVLRRCTGFLSMFTEFYRVLLVFL